ncbi:MAG: hypothetical protein AAB917_02110 [Patescibacteria group bacterium]
MNCRSYKQYLSMISDYEAGRCPFCDPLDEKNKVLHSALGWRVWENPYSLTHTSLHLIMAPQQHTTSIEDISPSDFEAMGRIFKWVRYQFNLQGGAFAMRFGSPQFNAGSVLHLHANIIVPDHSGAVQITLAKDTAKVEETIARMKVFEKLRGNTAPVGLSDKEAALIEGRLT